MIQPADTALSRRAGVLATALYALLIIVAWGGLELWGLGAAPFYSKGEPREGLVVWEMTHGGGWILPRRNGVELPSKPPLFHWLGAATALARGATDEWSIRFPSAALSLIALLCVFATGTALWSPRAGLASALGLMTMFEWARAATNARVDMTLTCGLLVALLSLLFFLRGRAAAWLIPLYLGIAWAVLGKGPVGAALPGLAALAMFAVTRDLSPLRRMRLGAGALAVALTAGSWYVMALLLGGRVFFRKQVLAENVFTFVHTARFGGGHQHGVWYLLGGLSLGLLPWTLFLPGVAARLWRDRRNLSPGDARVYLLVWIVVVFVFYAIAASKRSVYLLALYPAVALLLGWWWDEQCREAPAAAGSPERWVLRLLPVVCRLLAGAAVLLLLVVLVEGFGVAVLQRVQGWLPPSAQPFVPWVSALMRDQRWLLLGFLLLMAAASYACARAARAANWRGVFAGVCATFAAAIIAVRLTILPGIAQHQTLRGFMEHVRHVVGPNGTLLFYNTFDYQAVFYWNGHIGTYDGPLPAGSRRYLLMRHKHWEQLPQPVQEQYELVSFPDDADHRTPDRLVLIRRVGAQ